MTGVWLRKEAFWILDMLRSSKIKKCGLELKKIYEQPARINKSELNALMQYAVGHVPYYRNTILNISDISAFPVVSKNDYRKDFNSFRSDEYMNDEELHAVYTSGSTGNPFKAYQDRRKLNYHKAGLIQINESIGWGLGERYMFIRAWGSHFSENIKNFATNVVPVEALGLNDSKAAEICETLKRDKALHLILGYASSLEIIAEHALKNGYLPSDFGITLIISDSECLKTSVKAKIKKAFGCPVLNRYANNENGILAITDDETDRFHVNYAEYYVELLKLDSDEQTEIGEVGRIVITDLYNRAFPFIRYNTGDLGIASQKCGNQVVEISQLSGRVSDTMTDINGTLVSETAATGTFENYTPLRRYQLIQEGSQYTVHIEKPFFGDEKEVLQRAKRIFGEAANIKIEYVDDIPCGKNGKFKTMVRM